MNDFTDEQYKAALAQQLDEKLNLPADAIEYLLGLWTFVQVMDDIADEDPVERSALDDALHFALCGMQSNPFYAQYSLRLMCAMQAMVMKWQASDIAERSGCADERSYMWRAGFYDVVMEVAIIVHGPTPEIAFEALSLYGEAAASYMAEFGDKKNA